MKVVRMIDSACDIVDGSECENNIIKFNKLIKREQLIRIMLNELGDALSYSDSESLKKELSISISIRNHLCYSIFRGEKNDRRIFYIKASDGCEISDVYLFKYEEYLKDYAEVKAINNNSILGLEEREKSFELIRIDTIKLNRELYNITEYSQIFNFLNEVLDSILFKANYEDSGQLIKIYNKGLKIKKMLLDNETNIKKRSK